VSEIVYSVDTSALIEGRRNYPLQVFPSVWAAIEGLIVSGRLIAAQLVRDELERKDDEVYKWARAQHGLFVPFDRPQEIEAKLILSVHGRMVDERKNRNRADPFVIALAKARQCTVVTEEFEGHSGNLRIPYVCQQYGIDCVNLLELMGREGWRF
jgi:hypothetical protein